MLYMVKTILKRNNVLLSQFASDLNIPRPTLDSYIKTYDRGETLTNNLYQKIFDFLFADLMISNEEFVKKYTYVMNNYGNSPDLHSSSSATMSSLTSLVSDGSIMNYLTDTEENALSEMIMAKDNILVGMIKYYLLLTHREDINSLNDKDKLICERLFSLQKKIDDNDFIFDEVSFNAFEDKVNEKQESKKKEELKRELSAKVSNLINDAVENNDIVALTALIEQLKIK